MRAWVTTIIGIVLFAASAARAEAWTNWSWSLTDASSGTFTASESTTGGTLGGTFITSTSGFTILTVASASGSNMPSNGNKKYGVISPGFGLFTAPVMSTEGRVLHNVASNGECPTKSWTGNFIIGMWPTSGFNVNLNTTPGYGKFTWNPATNVLRLNAVYALKSHTLLASNIDISTNPCSGGIIDLNGTGDRSGKIRISQNGGLVYQVNTGTNAKINFAVPDAAIPSLAYLNATYSLIAFNHETTQISNYHKATFNSGDTTNPIKMIGAFPENNISSGDSYAFDNVTINSPSNGFFKARLKYFDNTDLFDWVSGGGTNDEVICAVYSSKKPMIYCLSHDNGGTDSKPRTFTMAGHTQLSTPGTVDNYVFNTAAGHPADGEMTATSGTVSSSRSNAMALLSSGKFLVAGECSSSGCPDATTAGGVLSRWHNDGGVDTAFNTDGYIVDANFTRLNAVATDSSGNIYAAGANLVSGRYYHQMAKYNSNGVIQTGFGSSGYSAAIGSSSYDSHAYAVALDSSSRVITAGESDFKCMVTRHTTTGTADSTFSGDGMANPISGYYSSCMGGIAVQSADNKILVTGTTNVSGDNMFVARLAADGTPDTTFASGVGYATMLCGDSSRLSSVALDSSNRVVVAGPCYDTAGGILNIVVGRYTSAGLPDSTFDSDGQKVFGPEAGFGQSPYHTAIAVQSDGKIVGLTCGDSGVGSFRLTTAGAFDSTFGSSLDGQTNSGVDCNSDGVTNYGVNSVAIQADGKIVGLTRTYSSSYEGAGRIVRFWGN